VHYVGDDSPDRETSSRRIEEHHRRTEQLVRAADLPLFALSGVELGAPMLAGWQTENGTLQQIGLGYGDPRDDGPPHVEVITYRPGRDVDVTSLIEQEQDRIDVESPLGPPHETTVVIDDVPTRAVVREGGPVWLVLAEPPEGRPAVAVLARHWPLRPLRLARVEDVESLLAQRRRTIDGTRRPPDPVPVVDVRRAHRDLVDFCLADADARERAGRRPRSSRAHGIRYGQLWEAAVLAQMRLSDQDRTAADGRVEVMVNELTDLREHAGWFTDDVELRETAIVETQLWVTELNPEVASAPCHEAWVQMRSPTDPDGAPWLDHWARAEARERWLHRWTAWAESKV
jgi:hypothetical protein